MLYVLLLLALFSLILIVRLTCAVLVLLLCFSVGIVMLVRARIPPLEITPSLKGRNATLSYLTFESECWVYGFTGLKVF